MKSEIKTKRLILRSWCVDDLAPFAELNSDPRVMEHFPALLSKKESDQMAKRMQAKLEEKGYGFWAISVPNLAKFIGFVGLNLVENRTDSAEIAWRISFDYWGQGYATEGALACIAFAFETLGLKEVVAFVGGSNTRSIAVMQKIGMRYDPERSEGGRLLYQISLDQWNKQNY